MNEKMKIYRLRNIIEMAWQFTGMTRVFEKGAGFRICRLLEKMLGEMGGDASGLRHETYCQWIQKSVKTRTGTEPSYGQAAKVIDIAMKVLVGYCQLPNSLNRPAITPQLRGAIDTPILEYLKDKYEVAKRIYSLSQIDKKIYIELQSLLAKEAEAADCLPIEYDDWLWRSLRTKARFLWKAGDIQNS